MTSRAEKHLKKTLSTLRMPAHLDGYEYIVSGIDIWLSQPRHTLKRTVLLYKEIGARFEVPPSRVDRNIRTAIRTMWLRDAHDMQRALLGYSSADIKIAPSNSEFMKSLLAYEEVEV